MESTLSPENTIEYISQPAFLIEDGIVTTVNSAASHLQIKTGVTIQELITVGFDEYANFRSGQLYLNLTVGRAWVSICGTAHLFCIEQPYSDPEQKALDLAAQQLRVPLSTAISNLELLKQNKSLEENELLKQQVAGINKSIHNLLRAVCNMSDATPANLIAKADLQIQNATSGFYEIFEKLSTYVAETGRTLKFTNLKSDVECALDLQLMERAILNLVSNAIKFSPPGSIISATLKRRENRLCVTITNTIAESNKNVINKPFRQYLRTPTIEDGLSGIGLGMTVVSSAMSAHAGTVLVESEKNNSFKITLSFPITQNIKTVLRSPIQLLGGYTGGMDAYLVELSDVLPTRYYE